MVLHALDIMMNHSVVYTEHSEKLSKQLVPLGDSSGQFFTCGGQNKPAVLFIFEKPLGIETLNHVGDAGLRNL